MEISQRQKLYGITYTMEPKKAKLIETENGGCRGMGEMGRCWSKSTNFQLKK